MINKHFILLLSILILLAACQPAVPGAAPIPFTGARASVLGASALTIQGELGARSFSLTSVLADTGRPTPGYSGIELGSNIQYGFSPDREQLAVFSFGAANCTQHCFHLIDLRDWKESLPPVELGKTLDMWASEIVFNGQASRIAFALNDNAHQSSQVVVLDIKTGKTVARAGWDAGDDLSELLFRMRFTPSGDLALYGAAGLGEQTQHLRAVLLDGDTLEVAWQQDLSGVRYGSEPTEPGSDPLLGRYLEPGAAFSPDGSRLYLVAADAQELTTVDFARRSVSSTPIRPPQSLLDRLMAALAGVAHAKMLNGSSKMAVLSPDGKRLYVVGQTMTATKLENGETTTEVTPHGLQVIDPASGAELAKLETNAAYMTISPDGRLLFLNSWIDSPAAAAGCQ